MSKPPFNDMMRVTLRDAEDRPVPVLDLAIEHDTVLQGEAWRPGVVLREERDLEAAEICTLINELGFETDADGVPCGAQGDLEDRELTWTAERLPKGTPRPAIVDWASPPAPNR